MNKALIAPIASIIVILGKEILGIELEPSAVETTINTILIIVAGIGLFINPKKNSKERDS